MEEVVAIMNRLLWLKKIIIMVVVRPTWADDFPKVVNLEMGKHGIRVLILGKPEIPHLYTWLHLNQCCSYWQTQEEIKSRTRSSLPYTYASKIHLNVEQSQRNPTENWQKTSYTTKAARKISIQPKLQERSPYNQVGQKRKIRHQEGASTPGG